MKNIVKSVIVLALLMMPLSCKDLLDNVDPSTSISQGQTLSNAGGVEAVRTSMYDRLHAFNYATRYMLGPSALADDLVNRESSTRFAGYVENTQGIGMNSGGGWATSYDLINDTNLIINGIEEGVLDPAKRKQYQGEAYMLRAFAYHHLVRTFGYEPGMTPSSGPGAGFELGVIIRTQPTLSAQDADYRARQPVSEVYDLIISDLEKSIELLSQGDAGSRTFVTQAAAEALMARVQLYARNWEQADSYATDALAHTPASLATPEEVPTMFDETTGLNPEGIFIVTTNPNTETLGVNDALSAYTAQQYVALVPTQDHMDLYDSNDARLSLYGPCYDELESAYEPGCKATHPAIDLPDDASGLELSKWEAEKGQYADNYPFFRVAEMKLIQAEARLKGGSGDPLAPLNDLRTNRGLSTYSGADVMEAIMMERRREFMGEGHRFFDLKRLGREIRKAPETKSIVINDLPYSDFKVLDDIPEGEVALSQANAPEDSVLIQNPGY